MKVLVEGVWVKLTDEQIKYVEQEKDRREKEEARIASSFLKVLHHFGFKRVSDVPGCYSQDFHNWFAEIIKPSTGADPYVWIVGNGIRDSAFPGGWIYWDPQVLFRELSTILLTQ